MVNNLFCFSLSILSLRIEIHGSRIQSYFQRKYRAIIYFVEFYFIACFLWSFEIGVKTPVYLFFILFRNNNLLIHN